MTQINTDSNPVGANPRVRPSQEKDVLYTCPCCSWVLTEKGFERPLQTTTDYKKPNKRRF